MKIATEPMEDHQVKLVTDVEAEEYEKSKHRAAKKISQEKRIPGFRPGKAPYEMVRRYVGEVAIREQALDFLIDDLYPKALEQAEIQPGAPGKLIEISEEEPPRITFVVPLAPVVDLGNYKDIRQEYQPPEVSQKEVDQFVERLRTSYATYEPVERPIEAGDMVSLTIDGHLAHPEEGQNAEILEHRPLTVVVKPDEEHPQDEWPFPGFAMQLVGKQAGEEFDITHTFTDESPYETLRSKEVEFHCKIESVKKMDLPELNDEFAQTVGEFSDLGGLQEAVRKSLETNGQEEYNDTYYNQLIDKIAEQATIKYPPQYVDEEIESFLKTIQDDLARQNMDLETYLKVRNMTREEFIDAEVRPAAIKRLNRALIIEQVAEDENIQPDKDKVNEEYHEALMNLENTGGIEKLRKQMPMNELANVVARQAVNRVMNRSVLERLKEFATSEQEPTAQAEANLENEQPTAEAQTNTAEGEQEPAPAKKKTRKKTAKAASKKETEQSS